MSIKDKSSKLIRTALFGCFCATLWQITGARAEGPLTLQETQTAAQLESEYRGCTAQSANSMHCVLHVFGSNTSHEILDHIAQNTSQEEVASFWILEKEIKKSKSVEETRKQRFSAWLDHYWTETPYRPIFETGTEKEVKNIFKFITKYPFRKIDLSHNSKSLRESDTHYLQDLLEKSKTLEELNYSENYIGELGPERIKKGLNEKSSKLRVLILDGVFMRDSEFRNLMTVILKHKTLKSVSFKNCGFDFSHFRDLALYFESTKANNSTLERIDVSGNRINEAQFEVFKKVIMQFFPSANF